MELVKLTFQNVNALAGTWTVDFQSLAEEAGGIFAIVGPTGSGKTSLLDAISLALFGTTPRVCPADERSTKNGQDMSACITKGYTQSMAELTFLHDGHQYRTRCTLRTSRSPEFTLEQDGVTKPYTRKEALRAVAQILRMDYAAFSRTLMLAQGHFNRFLLAKSEERLETLSTIAGVGGYQRIADALKARVDKNRKELEEQQNKADWSADRVLPEAELQAKTAALAELHEEVKISQQRRAELTAKRLQWQEVCTLKQEVASIASKLPKLQQLAEQFAAQETSAVQARDALHIETQREHLMKAQLAEQQRDLVARTLQEAERTLTMRQQSAQAAEDQVTRLQSQEKEAAEAQAKRLDWLKVHAADQGLTVALPKLQVMASEVQRQRLTVESQRKKAAAAEIRVKRAHEALESAKTALKAAQTKAQQAQAALEKAREQVTASEASVVAQVQAGEAFVNTRWQDAETAEEAESHWASWRDELVPHESCPLCGSKSHPYMDTPDILAKHQAWISQWKAQQEALKQAQTTLAKAQKAELLASKSDLSAQSDAKLAAESVSIKQDAWEKAAQEAAEEQSLLKQLLTMLTNSRQSFVQALQAWIDLPEAGDVSEVPAVLEERQKRYEETQKAADDYLRDREPQQAALTEAQKALAVAKTQAEEAKATQQKALAAHVASQKAFEAFDCVHPKATLEALEKQFQTLCAACEAARKATLQAQTDVRSAQKTLEEKKHTLQTKSEGLPESGEAEMLGAQISALEARLEVLISEEGRLRGALEEDAKHRKEHAALLKVLETMQREYSRWTTLEKFLDNDALKKVAQNLLLVRLLEIANERLRRLLPRYALLAMESPKSKASTNTSIRALEIMIEDAWLGGELRTTTNLSGGESFLISLVLAISLSDLSAQHFQLKNLFLDEGFGTLDSDCLQKALSILGNLHAEGRLVGIISHVEQLKRAPVRIEVQPSSTTTGFSSLACYVNEEPRPEIVSGDTSEKGMGSRTKMSRGKAIEAVKGIAPEEAEEVNAND